ncbi:hypothetical protein ACFQZ4_06160 [Catellatospora coxensis]|uniref:Uncharacterized protein n=1 Tax=Catellatospora coxensis TaxID=310354 RepID=A0A8J3KXT9_9ACTN|nr:hypothetical protein [Catellatospora coxensis]GIG05349.1 hypothetical protein Cco03nite_20490 [Catellatospora coxensis]
MQPEPTRWEIIKQNALMRYRLNLKKLNLLVGVQVNDLDEDSFTKLAKETTGTEFNLDKPELAPIAMCDNGGVGMAKLAEACEARSNAKDGSYRPRHPYFVGFSWVLRRKNRLGREHAYLNHTYAQPVPEEFQKEFEDTTSWSPFWGMLSMFAPSGGPVPSLTRFGQPSDGDPFADGDIRGELEEQRKLIEYRDQMIAANTPPQGLLHLGNAVIDFSRPFIIETPLYIHRGGLASTTPDHPLDGHTGWIQSYHKKNKTVSFTAAAGGRNRVPGVDEFNLTWAGNVFGLMLVSFAAVMKVNSGRKRPLLSLTDGITYGDAYHAYGENHWLGARRAMTAVADTFARFGALARAGFGTHVVESPAEDGSIDLELAVEEPKDKQL